MEYYLTVKTPSKTVLRIKKSKFITSVAPIEREEEAKAFIAAVKEEFPDATHHPYGYSVDDVVRSSDDGEPLNTAGKPILSAIEKKKVNNLVIVVTRYFGGVKLGIGGLIRAYREAALTSIEAAGITKKFCMVDLAFSVPYDVFGGASSVLEQYPCTILEEKMKEVAFFHISLRKKDKEQFISDLLKKTKGNVTVHF
jgi:uncharacterized YigZ family protein